MLLGHVRDYAAHVVLTLPAVSASPITAPFNAGCTVTDSGELNTTGGVGLGAAAVNDTGQVILSGIKTPAPLC